VTALSAPPRENKAAGILLVLAGTGLMTAMDGVAKFLVGADLSVFQILAVRGWFVIPVLLLWLPRAGGRAALKTKRLGGHLLRACFGILTPIFFFTGLKVLPLADAVAIFYGAPFIMTALSVPLLGERVGYHRWAAVVVGFVGVLIVTQPGSGAFQPAALLMVGASISYALLMLSGRLLGRTESVFLMILFFNVCTAVSATLVLPFVWKPMAYEHVAAAAAMAALTIAGHICLTKAFVIAPISVLTPFKYGALIWAALIGFVFWGDIPGKWVLVGAAVIAGSGLYMAHRESLVKKKK